MVFELKGKKEIDNLEEFCRLNDELTYIGQFADKETSLVIPGTILQYKGVFYSTESPLYAGVSSTPKDENGMVTTSVELFATSYVPEECKPVKDCSILIDIWDLEEDDKAPYESYAFYDNQLEEAKELVESYEEVEIFIEGVKIAKKYFLES